MNTDKKFFGALLIPARVALSRAGEFAGPQSSVGHASGWKLAQTLICAAFALMATSAVADNYSVTELSFIPTAVNTSGAVVGYGDAPGGGTIHAFLYSNGQTIDLGTLPGGDFSEALAINSSGEVVGDSTVADGATHAFLYSGGQMTDLGTLPGGFLSYATGINDSGAVVGWSDTLQPGTTYPQPDHAFLYSGGHMTDLGNLSASHQFVNFSHALAINNAGQVTGWSITDALETHAFLYSGGTMSDLGTLGGTESRGLAINNLGEVVGFSGRSDSSQHAFIYSNGMHDLGTLPDTTSSSGVSINDSDQIVGTTSGGNGPSFLYTAAAGLININTLVDNPNLSLREVAGINNAGQIAISGSDFGTNATVNGFLLSPATHSAANISTRLTVGTGDNVLIGGIIIQGNAPKTVIIRAVGPSLAHAGITNPLQDPTLELHDGTGAVVASNDNWTDAPNRQAIIDSQLAPTNNLESAVLTTLAPGSYTAIVRGNNSTTGIALVEVYDLDPGADAGLANISTRGFVQTGDNVMIGGFIFNQTGNATVLIHAQHGVPNALQDPTLELHDGTGALIASNDNWKSDQQQAIEATGLAPGDDRESAILSSLAPGNYTAIVRGKNETVGNALVEVYVFQ